MADDDEIQRPPTLKGSPLHRAERLQFLIWTGIVVVGIAILVGYFAFVDDDEPTRSTTDPEGELLTCPDSLEVAGPYRRGIDPAYDARMDWDGDGVSCES